MTDLHDILPPPGRTNATGLFDSHPADHNQIVDSVNIIANRVDALSTLPNFKVYADKATRDADTAAHVGGMLSWAISEQTLAIWTTTWAILTEPFQPFTPRLWVGGLEFGLGSPPSCGYRHVFGSCQFYLSANFGVLGPGPPSQEGDISLLPPLQPKSSSNGGFGTMYVSPMAVDAPNVGMGLFNGAVTLAGAPYAGQLAIGSPADGRLLNREDLPPNGNFNCYASGFFPTNAYS